jgi:hypothetical protein
MEEYLERLEDLCKLHGVMPPVTNILDLNHLEFGRDSDEVLAIMNELYEVYYETCE